MKTKYIILIAILGITFSSCSDWLDVKPDSNPREDVYWMTEQDAIDAVNACYWEFRAEELFGRNMFYEQCGADDFIFGRSRGSSVSNLANYSLDGREQSLRDAWTRFYDMMSRSNWVIYNLHNKSSLTAIEKRSLGEAYFMRAFSHFYIAYRHGTKDLGVPFDRYEDYDLYQVGTIPSQRGTVMENYDLINQDLDKAAANLPYFNEYKAEDYGRAHKAAAWALKVRVCAYWAQHDNAKWTLIPALVDSLEVRGGRTLLANFVDVFKIENEWSTEHIWSINSTANSVAGSIFPGIVLENKGWGRYNGWGFFKPTLGLYDEYNPNDKRRGVTLLAYNDSFVFFGETRRFYSTSDLESGFQLGKFMDGYTYGEVKDGVGISDRVSSNGNRPTTDLNLPLIRHAEMVLFKAEALIMQGQGATAATELNKLTSRAGLGDVYTNATMDDLKHERRCELAGEYTDRLFDLKRWGDWNVLRQAKMGRKHAERDDPASTWTPIEVWSAQTTVDPSKHIVFPYNPDDVVKSQGKLVQIDGYKDLK